MLAFLLVWIMSFIYHPVLPSAPTTPATEYVSIVRNDYDPSTNLSWGVVAVYNYDFAQKNPHIVWMQPRSFPGKVSTVDMLKTIQHDDYVQLVNVLGN